MLPSRHECTACKCAAFVAKTESPSTDNPRAQCYCEHSWQAHALPEAAGDSVHSKGGCVSTGCGGFYSTGEWSPHLLCTCGASWLHHKSSSNTLGHVPSPSPPPHSSSAPSRNVLFQPHLPIEPVQNPSQHAVQASRQGMQPTSGSSSFVGHPPPASAFTAFLPTDLSSQSSDSRRRDSYNRKRGTATSRKPQVFFPVVSSTGSDAIITYDVAIFPLSLLDDRGAASEFSVAEISPLIWALRDFNLILTITLSSSGEIWRELDEALQQHFTHYRIYIPAGDQSSDQQAFHHLNWRLLRVTFSKKSESHTLRKAIDIQGVNFTAKDIRNEYPKRFTDPLNAKHTLIFIAPRYGNITGEVTRLISAEDDVFAPDRPHDCFAERLTRTFLKKERAYPQCTPTCPSRVPTVSFPTEAPALLRQPPSLVVNEPTDGFHHLPSPGETEIRVPTYVVAQNLQLSDTEMPELDLHAILNPQTNQSSTPTAVANNVIPRRRPREASITEHMPDSSRRRLNGESAEDDFDPDLKLAVSLWRGRVMRRIRTLPDDQQVLVTGPTEEFVAEKCLELLLTHYLALQSPPVRRGFQHPSPPWKCREVEPRAFLQPYRDFRVEPAVGLGPERGAVRAMVMQLTSDQSFWRECGDYMEPVFQTKDRLYSPERLAQWSVCGTVCAIHALQLRAGPSPINPWLLLAATVGEENFDFTEKEINELDPTRSRVLACWFGLHVSDPLPSSPTDPLFQLLVDTGEDPNLFLHKRTTREHITLGRELKAAVLLGRRNIWNNKEFKAFKDGFNLKINEQLCIIDSINKEGAFPLICSLYSMQKPTPALLISFLTFKCEGVLLKDQQAAQLYFDIFIQLFLRYLQGSGHVNHPLLRDVSLEAHDIDNSVDDAFLRCRLLLQAVTGSDIIPLTPGWTLSITVDWSGRSTTQTFDPEEAELLPGVNCHACTSEAVLPMTTWLANALLEPPLSPKQATLFEAYVHEQLIVCCRGYNGL